MNAADFRRIALSLEDGGIVEQGALEHEHALLTTNN